MPLKSIAQAASNLDAWLDTWKDKFNGIHGYVVHHHMDALNVISPDSWTQSAACLAHLALFEKTGARKWLEKAEKEALYLAENYIEELHIFRNSNFEHKPGNVTVQGNLIHNAYPLLALAKTCGKLRKGKSYLKMISVVRDSAKNHFMERAWDSKRKIFKRSTNEKDSVFVLNMAAISSAAMAEFSELTGDKKIIEDICIPVCERIISMQEKNGSFPYDENKASSPNLYNALCIYGLLTVFEKTHDKHVLDSAEKAARYLVEQIDPETGLFYHRTQGGKLEKYPEFVAGSMIIAGQVKRLESFGRKINGVERVANSVISMQTKGGGIEMFHGFSDIFMPDYYPAEPRRKKWRDRILVPGWNALALENMVFFLKGKNIPKPKIRFPCILECDECTITEDKKSVSIVGKNGKPLARWIKTEDSTRYAFLKVRSGEQRILYSLGKRLFFAKPLLKAIYPFRLHYQEKQKPEKPKSYKR